MSEIKNAEIIGRPMYNKDVTISELEKQLKEANDTILHYAGKPFSTKDIYLDIFDLINIPSPSRINFDSESFSKTARKYLTKYKVKE